MFTEFLFKQPWNILLTEVYRLEEKWRLSIWALSSLESQSDDRISTNRSEFLIQQSTPNKFPSQNPDRDSKHAHFLNEHKHCKTSTWKAKSASTWIQNWLPKLGCKGITEKLYSLSLLRLKGSQPCFSFASYYSDSKAKFWADLVCAEGQPQLSLQRFPPIQKKAQLPVELPSTTAEREAKAAVFSHQFRRWNFFPLRELKNSCDWKPPHIPRPPFRFAYRLQWATLHRKMTR